jgi:hypothetical protein
MYKSSHPSPAQLQQQPIGALHGSVPGVSQTRAVTPPIFGWYAHASRNCQSEAERVVGEGEVCCVAMPLQSRLLQLSHWLKEQ